MSAELLLVVVPIAVVLIRWIGRIVVVHLAVRGVEGDHRAAVIRAVAKCFRWKDGT